MHQDSQENADIKVTKIESRRPSAFQRVLSQLEQWNGLDPAVRALAPLATRIVANMRMRSLIHGDATGIPLHGILTDVPFGAWWMAQFLDFFPDAGSRRAARRLVEVGLIGAVPTAVTGLGEWALADRGTRRVGILHATVNAVGTLIFLCSWVARLGDRHDIGVRLARLGGLVLIAGGFAGGYMRSDRSFVLDTTPDHN